MENTPPKPIQYQTEGKAKAPGPKVTPQKAQNIRGKVMEAEDAKLSGELPVRSGNSGFSGTGYVDFGKGKQSIEWSFNSNGNPQGELAIRYALAGGNRPLQLTVNGASQTIPFDSSDSWTKWKDWIVKVPFKKGTNVVRLTTLDASGGNIDHLQVID